MNEGEWRCRECGAVVEPKYLWKDTSMVTQYVPGLIDAKLEFEDGRGYYLRHDEQPTLDAEGRLAPDFLAKITTRDPDWWTPVFPGSPQ